MTQAPGEPTITTRQVAELVMTAVSTNGRDLIQHLVTDDVELRMPPRRVYWGRAGINDFLDAVSARLPDIVAVPDATYSGGEFAVVEFEAGGTTSDTVVDTTGCVVFVFDGALVRRIQLYVDTELWERLLA